MNEADTNLALEILNTMMEEDERKGLPSASNWRRYELCAGSYQLEQEARRLGQEAHRSTSKDAATGNRIHGKVIGSEDVELEGAEAVTAEFLQERAADQVTRIFERPDIPHIAEKRLWLEVDQKPALSGRFDLCYFTEKIALVIDFKTGWREPDPAEQNAQLKVLAILVAIALPHIEEVIVQLISGPYGVTEARYDIKALSIAYNDIISTLRTLQNPNAALVPSPEACRFCPAINICPAVKSLAPRVPEKAQPLPDGEAAATLLEGIETLERRIEEIRSYYSERFLSDPTYQIPGYAMVPGVVKRVVNDWDTARARLGEYLDAGAIKGAANYRLSDLERALGKVLKLKGQPLKDRFNQILNGLVEEKQNAPSLKRVKGQPAAAL